MSIELSDPLVDGFSPENVGRIYHGQPALVDGELPVDVLEAEEFKALSLLADGMTHKAVADALDETSIGKVRDSLQEGRHRLGIRDMFQVAGYFPLDPGSEEVGAKKLSSLERIPAALDILEAISVGKRNKQVAEAASLSGPTARDRLLGIEKVWKEDGLMATRVANAIRARYVEALEARGGDILPPYALVLTLPTLAKLEAGILKEIPAARA